VQKIYILVILQNIEYRHEYCQKSEYSDAVEDIYENVVRAVGDEFGILVDIEHWVFKLSENQIKSIKSHSE
jgi:hypothetical protein